MKIIFATKNAGKLKEVRSIMGDGYEVLSMTDAGLDPEVVENGKTFQENALIKVRAIGPQEDAVVLADDSGLCIDALGGGPGVYSARWLGEDTDYIVKNRAVLDLMAKYHGEERNAHYACVIAALFPDGSEECCEARMEGRIADAPSGEGGFGYDPIIFLPQFGKTVAEISLEEKNKISHRGLALEKMKEIIEKRCRCEKSTGEKTDNRRDKRIFVVSDTHRLLYGLETALYKEAGNYEYVIHLGDLEGDGREVRTMLDRINPLIAFATVSGNCDDDLSVPECRVVSFNDTRLFLAHGHRHINKVPGGPFDALASAALGNDCQIALFGHTHQPYYGTAFNGVVLINPGSISLPRQMERRSGYGILTIKEGGAFSWEQKYL